MAKITTIINRFDGGIIEDKKTKSSIHSSLISNFDNYNANKLIPQFAFVADENKTYNIVRFNYCAISGIGKYLFGLGYTDSSNKFPKLFYYNIDGGYAGGWVALGSGEGSFARKIPANLFFYKNYLYFWDTQGLSRYDGTVENDHLPVSTSQQAPSVLHPNTDIAYFFGDNIVYQKNGLGAVTTALTFAADRYISSACVYGNYLAITLTDEYTGSSTTGKSAENNSEVILWDMNSSLADINERIDFGRGRIVHLAVLDGQLTAVVDYFVSQNTGLGRGKILIKQARGYSYSILNHLEVDVNTANTVSNNYYNDVLKSNAVVDGNKLYFSAKAVKGGDDRHGIWCVDSQGRLNLDIVVEGATSYEGIYKTGNMWWIAHSADGSVERTDEDAVYSATQASVYESLINLGDGRLDGVRTKNLVKVGVTTEPLPTAGQIVLKYRKNEETSWTTIFTHTTDNSLSHFSINIESTGAPLPQFKEIQLRVESTGGAVLTGLYMESELLDTDN